MLQLPFPKLYVGGIKITRDHDWRIHVLVYIICHSISSKKNLVINLNGDDTKNNIAILINILIAVIRVSTNFPIKLDNYFPDGILTYCISTLDHPGASILRYIVYYKNTLSAS